MVSGRNIDPKLLESSFQEPPQEGILNFGKRPYGVFTSFFHTFSPETDSAHMWALLQNSCLLLDFFLMAGQKQDRKVAAHLCAQEARKQGPRVVLGLQTGDGLSHVARRTNFAGLLGHASRKRGPRVCNQDN